MSRRICTSDFKQIIVAFVVCPNNNNGMVESVLLERINDFFWASIRSESTLPSLSTGMLECETQSLPDRHH
jgi:hypothetical protein